MSQVLLASVDKKKRTRTHLENPYLHEKQVWKKQEVATPSSEEKLLAIPKPVGVFKPSV
jgi:hypothetical protein